MEHSRKIVGVFETENQAIEAIQGLKREGYTSDEISILGKNSDDIEAVTEETGTKAAEGAATGMAAGGVLGGITGLLAGIGLLAIPGIGPILAAGPIAATLTGIAAGAGAGGLVGGLIGLGIPEDEANLYNGYVNEGRILVLVDSHADRDHAVYNNFRTNRSLNADYYDNKYGVNRPL